QRAVLAVVANERGPDDLGAAAVTQPPDHAVGRGAAGSEADPVTRDHAVLDAHRHERLVEARQRLEATEHGVGLVGICADRLVEVAGDWPVHWNASLLVWKLDQ